MKEQEIFPEGLSRSHGNDANNKQSARRNYDG